MGALGIEMEKQGPQNALVEALDGRGHERNLRGWTPPRNGRRPTSLLMELITARPGDYLRLIGEIE